MRIVRRLRILALVVFAGFAAIAQTVPAHAANGDFVAQVHFSQACTSGIGVGITYDGASLWYSCTGGTDLYRADPATGTVSASYNIASGLGALAYDATRNAIWAGWADGSGAVRLIQLDASHNVSGSAVAFTATAAVIFAFDDGIAYDASDDTLYISADASVLIHHYTTAGTHLSATGWAGSSCYNSGVGLGGNLLYQGSDGCSHVWVTDKTTTSGPVVFDFSTTVVGDPNFRDEGLTCDPNTFKGIGKQVMWSVEAFEPRRAHAYEIPAGSCGFGGKPVDTTPPSCNLTGVIAGPPKQIQITTQDSDGGLQSIQVTTANNANVSVPPFTPGTTNPVVVTATKINQSAPSQVGLKVTDLAGNVTQCDPALLSVGNVAGERTQRVTLAKGEGKVTIYNAANGIRSLKVTVNGKTFIIRGLRSGQVATLDITSAVTKATNRATITISGPKGSNATVVIST